MLLQVSSDLLLLNSEHVESHSLGERSALTDGDDVSCFNSEGGGAVGLETCVSLLESLEFFNVMQVVSSNDDSSVHSVREHESLVQLSSDGWWASEWAFVVDVVSLNGGLWDFEAYSTLEFGLDKSSKDI